MKNKKGLIIITSVLFLIICCTLSAEASIKYVVANMTYGDTNSGNIIFSKNSGFYDKEFELRLYAPTKDIYYTLDGTDPDKSAIKYKNPITIKDVSQNTNVYSERTDVTAQFLTEEIIANGGDPKKEPVYQIPEEPVDKCNIIKAVYYDRNGEKSEIEERIYFIGFQEKKGYDDVNVISISTDSANLFDSQKGIYVLGDVYKEFSKEEMSDDYWGKEYWNHWQANYNQRGIEWERESHIQVFDTEKRLVLSQNAGIRIQGGGSRGFLPKSLNIYAREEYGANKLYYDFFATGYYPKRVTLSNGGDDYYTKIKDRLVSELADECDIVTMNYEPYVLFLNGEYWGFYYLTEKYDVHFIEHYYGVDKGTLIDDIIIIKNDSVETGVSADKYVSYSEMQEFILNNDMSIKENYENACELIDIQSFIDYFAVQGYIARAGDWPESNFALWRSRNVSDKLYEDGKWRWMLFDVNSTSMSRGLIQRDVISTLRYSSELFDSLCESEEFRRQYSARLLELSEMVFEENKVVQKIDEYIELMEEPMEKHYQRFFGTSSEKFYEGIDIIKVFFEQRREYIVESIKNNFGEEYLGENQ